MCQVQAILCRKGSDVLTVGPSTTVYDACILMNDHQVGALVVTDPARPGRRVHGIFTERDVLRRVVSQRLDPAVTMVRDVMTADVVTCVADTDLDDARGLFRDRRVRHLPVVDRDKQLVGMISIGDLNAWDLTGQEVHIAALEGYLYGMV